MSILSGLTSIYMLILFVRIILTWFGGSVRIPDILCRITDPYLTWFRRFGLRVGNLDLSVILGLAALSVLNQIFTTIARFGAITLGIIMAIILQAIWQITSFLLILLIIVLILRLVAYLFNRNIYSMFWRIIDTISQPVLYRINRFIFKGRIINFLHSITLSIASLVVFYIILRIAFSLLMGLLAGTHLG